MDVQDAKKLEEVKYMGWASEAGRRKHEAIAACLRELTKQGLAPSGARRQKELDIHFEQTEWLIGNAIELRRQLAGKFPVLLAPPEIRVFRAKLERTVDTVVTFEPVLARVFEKPKNTIYRAAAK